MNRIKELRKDRGLTQEQLAAMVGYDTSTIQRLESGKRKLKLPQIIALAQALKVPPGDIISNPDNPSPAAELVELLQNMGEEEQATLLRVAKSLVHSSQDRTPPKKPGRAA